MNDDKRIRTRPELKLALKKFTTEKEEFTTQEASESVRERANVHVNNNRVAQYLRGIKEFEYHSGLKRWVRKR
jgi:hypothetical protein